MGRRVDYADDPTDPTDPDPVTHCEPIRGGANGPDSRVKFAHDVVRGLGGCLPRKSDDESGNSEIPESDPDRRTRRAPGVHERVSSVRYSMMAIASISVVPNAVSRRGYGQGAHGKHRPALANAKTSSLSSYPTLPCSSQVCGGARLPARLSCAPEPTRTVVTLARPAET